MINICREKKRQQQNALLTCDQCESPHLVDAGKRPTAAAAREQMVPLFLGGKSPVAAQLKQTLKASDIHTPGVNKGLR